MRRVAVIGASGQLGADIVRVLSQCGDYGVSPLTHEDLEVSDAARVDDVLRRLEPHIVINCAAFHRVDECQDRADEAMRVNAVGAWNVARACAALRALAVYISTDYVFGACGHAPYGEDDRPGPVNVYGISKLAGEQLVASAAPRWLVVRVASLFGLNPARAKPSGFVDVVLTRARRGEPLRVVHDIRMSPTFTADAARALEQLVADGNEGVVHVTNAGSCTWYEFACRIAGEAGVHVQIERIPSSQYPARARRPSDSSLASRHVRESIRKILRPWPEALRAYLEESAALRPVPAA
jgi:dTDP-4-dehydrorhamnose reductase